MTYLEFHLVFVLPPLVALLALQPGLWASPERYRLFWVGVVSAIALVYTTPWDNYLVWREVWSYGSERVLGTIGYVPVEEYLFFLLQPALTGLWSLWLLGKASSTSVPNESVVVRVVGTIVYAVIGVVGLVLLRFESSVYMALILSWAGLALAGQWAVAGHKLWKRRRLLVIAASVPTVYLWLVDWVAIRDGIWSISARFTTGLNIAGLPVEEALFFLVTNLLVVQGLVLFLPEKAFSQIAKTKSAMHTAADAIRG